VRRELEFDLSLLGAYPACEPLALASGQPNEWVFIVCPGLGERLKLTIE
jgi:hypothetical protein